MTDRKYYIEIHDAEGVIIGDDSRVTQKFERAPEYEEDRNPTSDMLAWCDDLIERGKNIRDRGIPSDADSELEFDTWLYKCYDFLEEAGGDVDAFQVYEGGWVQQGIQEFRRSMNGRLAVLQATRKRLRRARPSGPVRKAAMKAKEGFSPVEKRAFLEAEQARYERNLAELRLQKAKYGLDVPLRLLNEIWETEAAIKRIKAELQDLDG